MNSGEVLVAASRGYGRSIGMISRTRPGQAAMMTTRVERKAASSTPWVTNTTVLRSFSRIWSSDSCMKWRVWASSAPNGSSMSSTFGLTA